MSEQNNQNTQESQTPHKRRVRYKGKYPKKFEEKYKELQPEKYKDTIAHVIQKGNTPAGMHISIMVNEILDFLKIQPGETGFDATLGYDTLIPFYLIFFMVFSPKYSEKRLNCTTYFDLPDFLAPFWHRRILKPIFFCRY